MILDECARAMPITEAQAVTVWSSSKVNNQTKDDEADDGDDLDRGEPKFGLTKGTSAQEIYSNDDNECDGDPSSVLGLVKKEN
jgi:hypothetical protein